jgi:hypothetical protein
MANGLIDDSVKVLRHKGMRYTIKTALAYLIQYKLYLLREYAGYLLWVCGGPKPSLRLYLACYRFLSQHQFLPGKRRRFWVGRAHRDIILREMAVDPLTVKYEVKGGYVPYIEDGEWDLTKNELNIHEAIQKIFAEGLPPAKTIQYRVMEAAVQVGDWQHSRGCRTMADVDKYFKKLVDIYDYTNKHRALPINETGRWGVYPDTILLSIARDGNYLLESGGTHRLSIARLLEIPKVNAVVIRKHYQYLKARDKWLD